MAREIINNGYCQKLPLFILGSTKVQRTDSWELRTFIGQSQKCKVSKKRKKELQVFCTFLLYKIGYVDKISTRFDVNTRIAIINRKLGKEK